MLKRPFHLCHLETFPGIEEALRSGRPLVAPVHGRKADVFAFAKRPLRAGETLDGIGGFTCYGTIDNAGPGVSDRLLTMGQSEGCTLKRALPRDTPIALDDVELPPGRLCDRLRAEQNQLFFAGSARRHAEVAR